MKVSKKSDFLVEVTWQGKKGKKGQEGKKREREGEEKKCGSRLPLWMNRAGRHNALVNLRRGAAWQPSFPFFFCLGNVGLPLDRLNLGMRAGWAN